MQYANVSVATLLERHPWAHEVLEWHGVDPYSVDAQLSLGTLCWLNRLDPVRLTRDLISANPEQAEAVNELLFGDSANNNEMWEFDERGLAFDPWETEGYGA